MIQLRLPGLEGLDIIGKVTAQRRLNDFIGYDQRCISFDLDNGSTLLFLTGHSWNESKGAWNAHFIPHCIQKLFGGDRITIVFLKEPDG